MTIFLIAEDLRNRKLIQQLEKEGSSANAGDLCKLVFGLMGGENRTDELYTFYFRQLEEHTISLDLSENIDLHETAFAIYRKLLL
jgi:hypothetical protein